MAIPSKEKDLAALFRRLGADDPKAWAQSQVHEGINQLHRFLFLRQAWSNVIREDDPGWIEAAMVVTKRKADAPFAGVGAALSRLVKAGASREDLTDVVRGMQAQLLFNLCYLLEDPSLPEKEVADVGWALVETDQDGEPTGRAIEGLHESVLETDPTGREMRPR